MLEKTTVSGPLSRRGSRSFCNWRPGADGLERRSGGGVHSGNSGVTLRENMERSEIGGSGGEKPGQCFRDSRKGRATSVSTMLGSRREMIEMADAYKASSMQMCEGAKSA
jgi:hypothetical protein